jgi:hypothetical protein
MLEELKGTVVWKVFGQTSRFMCNCHIQKCLYEKEIFLDEECTASFFEDFGLSH